MEIKVLKLSLSNMTIQKLKDFQNIYNSPNDATKESDWKKIHNFPIYRIHSKITTDKEFPKIDNGEQSGTK